MTKILPVWFGEDMDWPGADKSPNTGAAKRRPDGGEHFMETKKYEYKMTMDAKV